MKHDDHQPASSSHAQAIPTLHEAVLRCTAGRPHATTEEFGHLTGKAPQTIRKNFSQTGTCFGIQPLKLGNRLLWPTDAIARLLEGGLAR